jgi:NADH:ubiquinone oxidoreductase subunit 2 (subunit N)
VDYHYAKICSARILDSLLAGYLEYMSFRGTLGLFRAFAMIVGRIAPLAQTNLKRLLAYSSVGRIGLILIPLCGITEAQVTAIAGDSIEVLWALGYMLIYTIINVWGLVYVATAYVTSLICFWERY